MPTNTTATAHKSKYPQWSNGNWPSPVLPSGILRPRRVPDFFMPAQPFRRVGFAQKIYYSPLTWSCEQRIYGAQINATKHTVSAFHQMQCIHRLQSYNIYPPPSKHIAVNLPLLFSTTLTIETVLIILLSTMNEIHQGLCDTLGNKSPLLFGITTKNQWEL